MKPAKQVVVFALEVLGVVALIILFEVGGYYFDPDRQLVAAVLIVLFLAALYVWAEITREPGPAAAPAPYKPYKRPTNRIVWIAVGLLLGAILFTLYIIYLSVTNP